MNSIPDLQARFVEMIAFHGGNSSLQQTLWKELDDAYSSPSRHYHNWQHIAWLCMDIDSLQDATTRRILLTAAYYHDAVYDVLKGDNEAQSAVLATERLRIVGVPEAEIRFCSDCILATKSHTTTGNELMDHFTDADLAILGVTPEAYEIYTQQIRKEYRIYPDELYKPGRMKVLQHFLSAPRIYKTDGFYDRLEVAARANLERELARLG